MHTVSKSRCPKCFELGMDTRGDNLANYPDGHCYCFACGYHNSTIESRIQSITKQSDILVSPVTLPGDISIEYPDKVISWVTGYELTLEDLYEYNFLWSEKLERLIYPVWRNDSCVFWTGRSFSNRKDAPKWRNSGSTKGLNHVLNPSARKIVIVEDIVSAIKIRKAIPDYGTLVLFNSHNAISMLQKRKQYFYWLDNDMFRASMEYTMECCSLGYNVQILISTRDPKDESFTSIKRILKKYESN